MLTPVLEIEDLVFLIGRLVLQIISGKQLRLPVLADMKQKIP